MVDCLEHAISKEDELPKIIELVFKKIFKNNEDSFDSFNNNMRNAKDILKDYGINMEV